MKHLARSVLCLLLALLSGCLEFDSQEVVIHYDPQKDQIDALFLYRGLYAEGASAGKEGTMEKVLRDLDQALARGEFAFWCNWPFAVDPTKTKGPAAGLLPHVEVETGGLFTDPKGVLCGYQFVRVKGAKDFLGKLNMLLEIGLQAGIAGGIDAYGPDHKLDGDTRDLVREFLRDGQKLLTLEPGRIVLRAPCSAADHAWLKDQVATHLRVNVRGEVLNEAVRQRLAAGEEGIDLDAIMVPARDLDGALQRSPSFRFFWENDISIQRDPELTTVTLGVAGQPDLRIRKASDGAYGESLLAALRERGDRIEAGVPDQEIERRFAAFREREAVLPPELAALRAK